MMRVLTITNMLTLFNVSLNNLIINSLENKLNSFKSTKLTIHLSEGQLKIIVNPNKW